MILQVGRPGIMARRWTDHILKLNEEFGFVITAAHFEESWWWVSIMHDQLVGFAGAKPEHGFLFLGPCGVAVQARGRGIQRSFIEARLRCARGNQFNEVVTYTDQDNLYSANNFVRAGFEFIEPWRRFPRGSRHYYFGKKV